MGYYNKKKYVTIYINKKGKHEAFGDIRRLIEKYPDKFDEKKIRLERQKNPDSDYVCEHGKIKRLKIN